MHNSVEELKLSRQTPSSLSQRGTSDSQSDRELVNIQTLRADQCSWPICPAHWLAFQIILIIFLQLYACRINCFLTFNHQLKGLGPAWGY